MDAALSALVERVQGARAGGQPLDIRGGGTKAFYGELPQGQALDVRGLSGISVYEPSELVVTVRGGTPLAELEAALAEKGQCLPFEPPRFGAGGTVGGMVAAGLAGPARVSVGSVRDYVLGATLLNGRGEVLTFGGQVMKNVAGYDVSRLLAGSMGTLGVILEVSLKVLPAAPATATLRFSMDEAQAIAQLNEWGGQALPINASAWWDGTLVVRLRGALAAVQAAITKLGGELPMRQPVDWPRIVEQAMSDCLPLAERRRIELSCDWPQPEGRAPLPLQGDEALLTVLLRNLLDNAVRYAPLGTAVQLRFGEAQLEVENDAEPIGDEQLARLGERFHRPDGNDEMGSGLGLSIVQRIAALHGLAVTIEPRGGGRGLRVRVGLA